MEAVAIAREVKRRLTGKVSLFDVRLFGSRARGDDTHDSDLDIYIETGQLTRQERRLISEVVWEVGFENDVVIVPVVFSREALTQGPLSSSPLYKAIQREGIRI